MPLGSWSVTPFSLSKKDEKRAGIPFLIKTKNEGKMNETKEQVRDDFFCTGKWKRGKNLRESELTKDERFPPDFVVMKPNKHMMMMIMV